MTMIIIIIIIIHKPPLVHLFQTDQYWLSSDEAEPLEIEAASYNITYVTFISQLGSQIKKPKLQWKWRGEKTNCWQNMLFPIKSRSHLISGKVIWEKHPKNFQQVTQYLKRNS